MKDTRIFIFFLAGLIAGIIMVTWFSCHTVRTTLPRTVLERYSPDTSPSIVFMGTSVTDAAIDSRALDSLLSVQGCGVRTGNLALAEMSGDAYYYLIAKNWVIPRGVPAALCIEMSRFPFSERKRDFSLEGRRIPTDLILSELMSYRDYLEMSGKFPGVLNSVSFFLHKRWFVYHHRLNIQWKIVERLPRVFTRQPAAGPYAMREDAYETMKEWARGNRTACRDTLPGISYFLDSTRYFGNLVTLCRDKGITLVFFWPPFPPNDAVLRGDPVYERYIAGFRSVCDSLGIITWDLHVLPGNEQWSLSDRIHLDKEGRAVFTRAMAGKIGESLICKKKGGRGRS